MFLFRPHRAMLYEAMKEVKEFNDKYELVKYIKKSWEKLENHGLEINNDTINVKPYGYDDRIGWDTHIVIYEKDGKNHVEGFTNGPV